ncbi:uncharacterized protein LOC131885332 [Tigriopus californicus]|uniref:uncharacterized protein LOC131885332 n=1 Tax=Tigriopus californicus TaxID=6832 RepID=UPI0027DA2125|nr:uncharacterized protein LOC131885332 [Tigriopus californicus]XP_059089340.1 uncharacterized protein LOC131885332 [Tigriopus californicus]
MLISPIGASVFGSCSLYIYYSSGNISEQERSMIRRDLVVVLRDLGRNTRLVYGKERRIFYHSKGLVTYYRQKLFKEVKKIKPQSKKKEKVQVPEFPMAVSFKLNEDGEECLVKCPICELQFERGSETYFSHLGRYHFNPYCEPRTFQQPNCGYSIEDGVDHFKHAHSHSNGTIPFEANGNIRFEAVEKSTYPKTGTALACWNPCPICLKNIATDNELQIHFVIIHCLSEILLHIPRKKDSTDTHLCPRIGCLEIFSDVWQLAMHLGIKHDLIRSWLKPIPKKDAIRCPLKNCLDRSVSGEWSKAQSHLSQHAIGFVIEEIAKLQRTLGKDDGQCPMVGCSIEKVRRRGASQALARKTKSKQLNLRVSSLRSLFAFCQVLWS